MKHVLIAVVLVSTVACFSTPLHPSTVPSSSFQDRAVTLREAVALPQTLQPIPEAPVETPAPQVVEPPPVPEPAPLPGPVPCKTPTCEVGIPKPAPPCPGGICVDPKP